MELVNNAGNILLFHCGVGYVLDRDARVFIAVKGCAKIDFKILIVINWALGV